MMLFGYFGGNYKTVQVFTQYSNLENNLKFQIKQEATII